MTRGQHTTKSAARIARSKPGVSSFDPGPRASGTDREISPVRRMRLQEPRPNETVPTRLMEARPIIIIIIIIIIIMEEARVTRKAKAKVEHGDART
jgi:hypothetical protein